MEFPIVFAAVSAICFVLCLWVYLSAWLLDGVLSGKGHVYEIAFCVNAVVFVSLLVSSFLVKL
jgi:hypothetical protein